MVDVAGGVPGLADRLNHLFATVLRSDGRPWTNEKAAAALHALGAGMSDGYLSQLRNGKKNNPSARHLAAIAELFGVPVGYFFDAGTAERLDADLPLLAAVRDPGVRRLASRARVVVDQHRKFDRHHRPGPEIRASPRDTCRRRAGRPCLSITGAVTTRR